MISCALFRGDSTGPLLLVSQTKHQIEIQSEKVQTTALQSLWAISSSQAWSNISWRNWGNTVRITGQR